MNAADSGQVEIRTRQQKRRVQRQHNDLKAVVSIPEGRRMLQWLIDHLRPEGNLWNPNAAIAGFNACRSDVASFIEDCIDQVDQTARIAMLTDKVQQQRQDDLEYAAHVAGQRNRKPANETEAGGEDPNERD